METQPNPWADQEEDGDWVNLSNFLTTSEPRLVKPSSPMENSADGMEGEEEQDLTLKCTICGNRIRLKDLEKHSQTCFKQSDPPTILEKRDVENDMKSVGVNADEVQEISAKVAVAKLKAGGTFSKTTVFKIETKSSLESYKKKGIWKKSGWSVERKFEHFVALKDILMVSVRKMPFFWGFFFFLIFFLGDACGWVWKVFG